jgi:hypothetical protein
MGEHFELRYRTMYYPIQVNIIFMAFVSPSLGEFESYSQSTYELNEDAENRIILRKTSSRHATNVQSPCRYCIAR